MKNSIFSFLLGSSPLSSRLTELIYALFRFYCGYSIAIGAGLSKVFHKINEDGDSSWGNLAFGVPAWFVKQVGDIGFTFISPSFWAYVAVYGEFIGGLLIAIGLLTRLSAIQMAFQFFVVSFIWYDSPALFDMYYQQLIFWSFVLIAGFGDGRYSVAGLLGRRKGKKDIISANIQHQDGQKLVKTTLIALVLFGSASAQAQSAKVDWPRVHFTITNGTLRTKQVDIRYYDGQNQIAAGYGYSLGPLGSHAVSMPVGTRIYKLKGQRRELVWVISAADEGRQFEVNKHYEISREQWLQVSWDETYERTISYEKPDKSNDLSAWAKERGIAMVPFVISGNSFFGKKLFVRVQLPGETSKTNIGFSRRINWFDRLSVSYPVGSRIYLCDGAYWNDNKVREQLVLDVTAEKANYLIRF
jgi:uncharacterized membrane protein YphA (DoxX/SURF4 family)